MLVYSSSACLACCAFQRSLGSSEVPEATGSGKAVITFNAGTGKVCWTFSNLKGVSKVNASHIHNAPKGKAGAVVVPLNCCATATA